MADATAPFDQATKEIHYYAKWAAGAGVVPFPLIDIAAVTGVQVKLINRLAKIYGHDAVDLARQNRLKSIVGALLGAGLPARIGHGGIGALVYTIPVIGTIAGLATVPAFNYASTVAVGRIFQKHFASGGTLLTFDAESMKSSFTSEVRRAADEAKSATRRPDTKSA